ncbi:MAG: hypothetical protein ABI572_04285 [Actinomycetota bacterium]
MMTTFRRILALSAGVAVTVMYVAGVAQAQVKIENSATPVENNGGWVYQAAQLLTLLGIVTVVFIVIGYMRFAPRFAKDVGSADVVRADRVVIGRELPRRNVDLSQASPVTVAPPAVPVAAGIAATPAPAAAAPAPASPPAAPSAAAEEAPVAPEAATPAPAPAAPAAPAERVEVSMDQEVFDATLADLLASGTDRRIAEGKARRAGMIAAKKKAAGES